MSKHTGLEEESAPTPTALNPEQKLESWRNSVKNDLDAWSVNAMTKLKGIFDSLCQQEDISDKDFVLALEICRAMIRPSKWGFAEHACFDKIAYENWLKSSNLPLPQARKSILELVWITADSRDLSDIEKMVYALGHDFDISAAVVNCQEFSGQEVVATVASSSEKISLFEALAIMIVDVDFSVRVSNCLKNERIEYVGQLVTYTEAKLLRVSMLGKTSLDEIKEKLASMNLRLGMDPNNYAELAEFLFKYPPALSLE